MAYQNTIGIKVTVDSQEVVGVTDIPALGASPEKIDVTTLADESRKYINGVKDFGDLEFSCLYDPAPEGGINYAGLKAMEGAGAKDIVVELKDGSKFTFSGEVAVAMGEAAVNAAMTFTLSVALTGEIEFEAKQA